MGDMDNYLCKYLGIARYNADFWNGTVFRGKRRVKVWQLKRWQKEDGETRQRRKKSEGARKQVQMLCKGKKDVLLTVEIMTTLDYCIPTTVGDYDMHRSDATVPIRTLILYCGEGCYEGAAELQEMPYFKPLQNDWVRIYNLKDLKEENYETSFREIVAMFKRRDDREAMKAYYMKNRERFGLLDEISIDLMGALIGIRNLKRFPQEKGGVDMCKAFEEERKEEKFA